MADNLPKQHYQLGSKCSNTTDYQGYFNSNHKGGPTRSMTDRDGHGGGRSEHPKVKGLQKPYLLSLLREIFEDCEQDLTSVDGLLHCRGSSNQGGQGGEQALPRFHP